MKVKKKKRKCISLRNVCQEEKLASKKMNLPSILGAHIWQRLLRYHCKLVMTVLHSTFG